MNNRIKMTVKILLIVMMPTFAEMGGGVIIKYYEGEKFQKVLYEPPNIKRKRVLASQE